MVLDQGLCGGQLVHLDGHIANRRTAANGGGDAELSDEVACVPPQVSGPRRLAAASRSEDSALCTLP